MVASRANSCWAALKAPAQVPSLQNVTKPEIRMPWKEPGKGDKDPWSSGDQPPDLEEVFRNLNSRLRGLSYNFV